MLCRRLLLVYRHTGLSSLCSSHQEYTCRLVSESLLSADWFLYFHPTLDSGLIQQSGLTARLCESADRTSRGPAIYFGWRLFHRPSAAASCWASAVPGRRRRRAQLIYLHSKIMQKRKSLAIFVTPAVPGKGVYISYRSTPAVRQAVHLYGCGQIWAAETITQHHTWPKIFIICALTSMYPGNSTWERILAHFNDRLHFESRLTYRRDHLKLRPLSVTLFKEFTRHQLCNLGTLMPCHHYFFIFI